MFRLTVVHIIIFQPCPRHFSHTIPKVNGGWLRLVEISSRSGPPGWKNWGNCQVDQNGNPIEKERDLLEMIQKMNISWDG